MPTAEVCQNKNPSPKQKVSTILAHGMGGAPKAVLGINTKANWHILLLIATCTLAGAASANPPTVTAPLRLGDQFQFTLLGSNVPYIVEASTDLQSWSPVATNTDRSATRLVVLPASESMSFYRVAEATPLFGFAIAASAPIDLGGNNTRIDSFDSSDPIHSNNGQYDPAKSKGNGDVATASRVFGCINVGNSHVSGRVLTGPDGTIAVGSQGSVGDLSWTSDIRNNGKIQPGYLTDDMKIHRTDAKLPPLTPLPPTSRDVGGTNYSYVLDTGRWVLDTFSGSNQTLIATGDAVLYVKGSVAMSGRSSITISSGARLQMYVGDSVSIGGDGIINGNNPSKFILYGLNSCTNVHCSASSPLTGCIYAPNAGLTVSGSNSVTGAFLAKSVLIAGGCSVHYDESLRSSGPFQILSLLP